MVRQNFRDVRPESWEVPTNFDYFRYLAILNPMLEDNNFVGVRNWFWELLITEFVYDFAKIEVFFFSLENFHQHTRQVRRQHVKGTFEKHPYIRMAINLIRDPIFFFELRVSEEYTTALEDSLINEYHACDQLTGTRLFLTRQVELMAIENFSYKDVLFTMCHFTKSGYYIEIDLFDSDLLIFYDLICNYQGVHPRDERFFYNCMREYADNCYSYQRDYNLDTSFWQELVSARRVSYVKGDREVEPLEILCLQVCRLFSLEDYGLLMQLKRTLNYTNILARLVLYYHANIPFPM